MYQPNYNYQSNYSAVRPQIPNGLKGRPVSSIEEARASSIDFDGTVFYFPDLANKRIYTKQINLDGTSTLLMYELSEIPTVEPAAAYITRAEFDATIGQLKSLLTSNQQTVEEAPSAKPEFNF